MAGGSWRTTVPSWATFTASTGVLTGTPLDADVGDNSVVITASDGNGGSVTDTFTIAVANTNDAPSVSSTAVTAVNEDASYSYSIATSDDDSDSSDSWTITSTSVSWLTLTHTAGAGTAALAGIPDDGLARPVRFLRSRALALVADPEGRCVTGTVVRLGRL